MQNIKLFNVTQYKRGIPRAAILKEIKENLGKIALDYPMSSINSSNSHLDIIHDYLEASYIAEELGKFASSITAQEIPQDPYSPICRFIITVRDIKPFLEKLTQISLALYDDLDDDDILIEHNENLNEYTETLDERLFFCPELVDGYYANLVGAAYFELESESDEDFLKEEYKKYPEREYGFWISAYSKTIGANFYTSRECWVVPLEIDILKLLSDYSGLSSIEKYSEATLFSLRNVSYLTHSYGVVYFPFSPFLKAKSFVNTILKETDHVEDWSEDLLTYSPESDYIKERYGFDITTSTFQIKYLLSQSNQSIIVEDKGFRYVFFPGPIKANKLTSLYDQMSTIFGNIGEFAGVIKNVSLSWEHFDDEKFENLCYDLIYHDPRYDYLTIRKMGKSRSRDGGRDIVVYTKERPGNSKKLYIFQCKFTKGGSSLTTHKLENISDTINQYKAQGYGVMTPVVIDSALYDRIDGICSNFQVESDTWSILEIERFIARHPNLKERHFKN